MSQHLPVVSGRELMRALERIDFVHFSGGKGSHIRMRRRSDGLKVTIPDHKPVKRGTLKSILRQANISADELRSLL